MSIRAADIEAHQLGERFRELREERGWTQLELALALGVAVRTIKRYEAGKSTIPSNVLFSMRRLGMDVGRLLGLSVAQPCFGASHAVDETVLREVVARVDERDRGTGRLSDFERTARIVGQYLESTSIEPTQDSPRAVGLSQTVAA